MSRDERTSISSGSSEPPTPPSKHIIKKDSVNSLLTVNSPQTNSNPRTNQASSNIKNIKDLNNLNNYKESDSLSLESALVRRTEVFGLRVPALYYYLYSEKLTGEEKSVVKEAMRQFFISLITNMKATNISVNTNNNMNFNVNLVINNNTVNAGDEFGREYVDALKEKIKELQEIARIYREKAERLEKTLNAVRQALSCGDVSTARKVLGLR